MVTDLTHLGDVDLLDLLHPLDPGLGDDLLRLGAALLEGGDLGVLGDGGGVDGHLPHGRLLQVALLPLRTLRLQPEDLMRRRYEYECYFNISYF